MTKTMKTMINDDDDGSTMVKTVTMRPGVCVVRERFYFFFFSRER